MSLSLVRKSSPKLVANIPARLSNSARPANLEEARSELADRNTADRINHELDLYDGWISWAANKDQGPDDLNREKGVVALVKVKEKITYVDCFLKFTPNVEGHGQRVYEAELSLGRNQRLSYKGQADGKGPIAIEVDGPPSYLVEGRFGGDTKVTDR